MVAICQSHLLLHVFGVFLETKPSEFVVKNEQRTLYNKHCIWVAFNRN